MNQQSEEKLNIYTSVYPIQFAVEKIGGETINALSVFPPGVDAHSYEPTTKTLTTLAKSDAFIYMGAGMEGFSESIADALESEDVKLYELGNHEELFEEVHQHDHVHNDSRKEESSHHHDDGHNHGDHDPHIWIDPLRMIEMSHIITEYLSEINPRDKELYHTNFQQLKEDLTKLDKEFKETLQNKADKQILVSHAAYGYWEDRYGIVQIPINGLSSTSEPSQKDLVDIIEQAKDSKLKYVIFEQNTTSKVSSIIQDYIDAEALTIHNLAILTENDIREQMDYLSLMRQNLQVLNQATQ
ncbi:metal ABC transporter solute-binding protein, Zn/Mn family [Paucisalibacillus sp. EB02]|uniref:metal ABC transporter solute-binding protein, Zn/Mn family n=1 Tax=Paucisalibacillus sp. EB02 TaxID=1347087 RepID=UPI0004BBEF46|nr:zinc ABC transporter substrate-binding protein [Paucisalibacillus sp. EB02]